MKITIEMKAKPEKIRELYQTLQALLPSVRMECGCRDCRVYRDLEFEDVFILTINWEEQEGFDRFIPSATCGTLLGAIRLLSGTARIRVGDNEPWKAIESLKKVGVRKKAMTAKKPGSCGHVNKDKLY